MQEEDRGDQQKELLPRWSGKEVNEAVGSVCAKDKKKETMSKEKMSFILSRCTLSSWSGPRKLHGLLLRGPLILPDQAETL